jgi:hypothetical protein
VGHEKERARGGCAVQKDLLVGFDIKHLRRTTSDAAGNGLGATLKYLLRSTSAAANNA